MNKLNISRKLPLYCLQELWGAANKYSAKSNFKNLINRKNCWFWLSKQSPNAMYRAAKSGWTWLELEPVKFIQSQMYWCHWTPLYSFLLIFDSNSVPFQEIRLWNLIDLYFDLSWSNDGAIGLPIYGFLLMLKVTYGLPWLLYEI